MEDKINIFLNESKIKNSQEWNKVEQDLLILGIGKYSIDKNGIITRLDPLEENNIEDGLVITESKIDLDKYYEQL